MADRWAVSRKEARTCLKAIDQAFDLPWVDNLEPNKLLDVSRKDGSFEITLKGKAFDALFENVSKDVIQMFSEGLFVMKGQIWYFNEHSGMSHPIKIKHYTYASSRWEDWMNAKEEKKQWFDVEGND